MPFTVVRNDLTKMAVDAIVNPTDNRFSGSGGTDLAVHRAAGPALAQACRALPMLYSGQVAVTGGYGLACRYVIHTVGPFWMGGQMGEEAQLFACYSAALEKAREMELGSIAFPLISSGSFGFPKDRALQIAIEAFSRFLLEQEMEVYLVVYDETSYRLSEMLFSDVANYLQDNLPRESCRPVCSSAVRRKQAALSRPMADYECASFAQPQAQMPSQELSLAQLLQQADAGFSETLLKLIDSSGKKDSEIYKKAGLTKQHFSKIRNNPGYKPTKPTALALAIALELNVEQTQDLIGRAGYTLSGSSKFDLIIRYFIEKKNYNIVQINIALYEFDQSLLGV